MDSNGNKHWDGKLFVFDDRMAIPISDKGESKVIGTCHYCKAPNETYYNCANLNCNELFLCCPDCLKEHTGCCCKECTTSNRLRPSIRQPTSPSNAGTTMKVEIRPLPLKHRLRFWGLACDLQFEGRTTSSLSNHKSHA